MKKKFHFNIVDIIIILLILGFVFTFISFKNKTPGATVTNTENIKAVFRSDFQTLESLKGIKVGDKLFTENSAEAGVIEKIDVVPYYDTNIDADGKAVAVQVNDYYAATITTSIKASNSGPYLEFNGDGLKVGSTYRFRTPTYECFSTVLFLGEDKDEK